MELYSGKKSTEQTNNKEEDTCVNVYRVVNEVTLRNSVYMDENGIIYNSIYNFREDIPTKKKLQTFSK